MTDQLDQIAAQQAQNTANIADLITLSANVLKAVDGLKSRIDQSNQRFDILREDAIADRKRYDEDRKRSDERFDRMLLEIRAMNQRVTEIEES